MKRVNLKFAREELDRIAKIDFNTMDECAQVAVKLKGLLEYVLADIEMDLEESEVDD